MEEYKNKKEFENAIRGIKAKSHTVNDCPDNVKIGNIIFTMDNYDEDGKEICYCNKRTFKGFTVKTENRYSVNGFKDAVVSEIDETCIRNDIVYLD